MTASSRILFLPRRRSRDGDLRRRATHSLFARSCWRELSYDPCDHSPFTNLSPATANKALVGTFNLPFPLPLLFSLSLSLFLFSPQPLVDRSLAFKALPDDLSGVERIRSALDTRYLTPRPVRVEAPHSKVIAGRLSLLGTRLEPSDRYFDRNAWNTSAAAGEGD